MEIKTNEEIDWLENSNLLTLKKDKDIFYTFAANNFEDLKQIEKRISKIESVVNYQLNK